MTDYYGIEIETTSDVYEPSDDSKLMVEAVKKHAKGRMLDLGCGSGIVGIAALKSNKVNSVLFADINPDALIVADRNATNNCVQDKDVSFVESDLFSVMKTNRFDTIAFNPPYLPTSEEEKIKGPINHAYDGGLDGRAVTDRFLAEFLPHMNPTGVLILLQSSLSNTNKTIGILEKMGFQVHVEGSAKFFFEEISCLIATRART